MTELRDLINESSDNIILACKLSRDFYKKPLIISYSGGKDSDVVLNLALNCLEYKDFQVDSVHTSVDAPETVYYIRDKFKWLNSIGVKTNLIIPRYKDGTQKTMYNLIYRHNIAPTRISRFCCQELKENNYKNNVVVLGVREQESIKRRGRDIFVTGDRKYINNYDKLYNSYINNNKNDKDGLTDCIFIEYAKQNKNIHCNAIYRWSDINVWDYLRINNYSYNPLYDKGYKRVGCVGCPMSYHKKTELEHYYTYKNAYIKLFQKMIDEKKITRFKNGIEFYNWWVEDYSYNPDQLTLDKYI